MADLSVNFAGIKSPNFYVNCSIVALFILLLMVPTFGQLSKNGKWSAVAANQYEVTSNITYLTVNGQAQKLDLYVPYETSGQVPALVWLHGGGWTRSSKEQEMLYILPYLEAGWTVVNVEYRLASAAPAPAAVEDCRCALRWVFANAGKYKIDPKKIVVSGISAGGHLALTTGILPASAATERLCPGVENSKIAAIVNWFGPGDVLDLIEGKNAFDQALTWFAKQPNRIETAKMISPINYIKQNLPPIITIHGDKDDVIPYEQSVRLHHELNKFNNPNRLFTVKGRGHGDFSNDEFLKAYAAVGEFLVKNDIIKNR